MQWLMQKFTMYIYCTNFAKSFNQIIEDLNPIFEFKHFRVNSVISFNSDDTTLTLLCGND